MKYAPVFDQIAELHRARGNRRELSFEALQLLKDSGFTRTILPEELGGDGTTLLELAQLLIELAAADPNLPQVLHGHLMYTEVLLREDQGEVGAWWLNEVAAGKVFANALAPSPKGPVYFTPDYADHRHGTITGTKSYCTGALLADYLLVSAEPADADAATDAVPLLFVVDAAKPGITRHDDWNGFGQQLTASGTTEFHEVEVGCTIDVFASIGALQYAYLGIILTASQVGIGQAALADAIKNVRARQRVYTHGTGETVTSDPLVATVLGEVSAKVSTAAPIVRGVAAELAGYTTDVIGHPDPTEEPAATAIAEANVAIGEAMVVVSELILEATNQIFEVGGASALDQDRRLHTHWLNARTISSHTPLIYRSYAVGNYRLNGIAPDQRPAVKNKQAKPAAQTTGAH